MTVSLATLLIQATKAQILNYALGIAQNLGLPVTSWQAGDPTRSLYMLESELLSTLESVVVGFISSGFLDFAHGDWLNVKAKQDFGVDVPGATFASTSCVLTNSGGSVFDDIEVGAITAKNTSTGKTYRNVTGGALAAAVGMTPATLALSFTADEAGADSSAGEGEIDDLVTTMLGVTISNPTAAIGLDAQDESTTVQQCRDKLGSLSPDGPKEAYAYVARNPDLAGTRAATRVRVYSDSDTGDVTVYLASSSGPIAEPDRALIETAILTWATPLCITPTVLSATGVAVAVTYTVWLYKSANKTADEAKADILAALENMIATRPIGGDIIPPAATGSLYASLIESTIRAVYPQVFRVVITLPGDTSLGNGQVATLGAVTGTVNLVVDP